ncbi:hypothetical protein LK540_23770 [Massilia sp. IC2-278]|uniref:DUF6339 family protein n=1 Tax=Massilia sp. IC2-278 TaxID=2887200 RepID=UPI001E535A5C|nr:DUF6339 family protein [Massilia sp. IC2-278]MCC2963461.1 hypothetical protein [Massilia sp. IC2-278]
MLEIKLLKERVVSDLLASVPEKLNIYRNGSFESLLADSSLFLNSPCLLDTTTQKYLNELTGKEDEVDACLAISNGLKGMSAYIARDERLWVRLSHIEFLPYARTRWPIPEDDAKAITHIKKHFFAIGSRGIERDNALSRLWWMSEICGKVQNLSLKEALQAFLFQSDVRASIVERPTTSQSANVLSAVVNKLHESYVGDQSLFEREKFRTVMKRLNIEGGVRLLEALDSNEVEAIVKKAST